MAQQDPNQEDDSSSGPTFYPQGPANGPGALGALRMIMGGQQLPGTDLIEKMASQPVLDPSTKWLRAAGAAISPEANGNFAAGMGGALGALANTQSEEAKPKAQYMPIVAQALLQRQMQAFNMQLQSNKLLGEFDGTISSSVGGLLTQPNGVRPQDVYNAVGNLVQQGRVPMQYAQTWLANMPADPTALSSWLKTKVVGATSPKDAMSISSPDLKPQTTNGGVAMVNTNANAGPTPVGAVPGGVPQTAPDPKAFEPTVVETPYGKYAHYPFLGKAALVGSPENQTLAAQNEAIRASMSRQAVAPQGAPPQPPPQQPQPMPPQAPPQSTPQPAAPPQPGPGPGPGSPAAAPPTLAPVAGPGPQAGGSTSLGVDPVALEQQKAQVTKQTDDFVAYQKDLNGRLQALQDVLTRAGQMRDYLKDFRTGATAEARMKVAGGLKDLLLSAGVPTEQAAALGDKLMDGKLSSAQAFQKLAGTGAMDALKSAAGPGQRFTQAEFGVFSKNSPNLMMDPSAIEKILNVFSKGYQQTAAERDFVQKQLAAGTPMPAIRPMWSKFNEQRTLPLVQNNVAAGTTGAPTQGVLGNSVSGRRIVTGPDGVPRYAD